MGAPQKDRRSSRLYEINVGFLCARAFHARHMQITQAPNGGCGRSLCWSFGGGMAQPPVCDALMDVSLHIAMSWARFLSFRA